MNSNKETDNKIIEEFKEEFQFLFAKGIKITIGDDGKVISDFILKKLAQQREEYIKDLEGLKKLLPKQPTDLEMLNKETFKKQSPHRTGVEIDIENNKRKHRLADFWQKCELAVNEVNNKIQQLIKKYER